MRGSLDVMRMFFFDMPNWGVNQPPLTATYPPPEIAGLIKDWFPLIRPKKIKPGYFWGGVRWPLGEGWLNGHEYFVIDPIPRLDPAPDMSESMMYGSY